jgi:alkanesulfonate monooxygenase SsuD/methylene tetrahydromethanopterin reductase-like flavin-dependent oxidoreductase (luciferase family)
MDDYETGDGMTEEVRPSLGLLGNVGIGPRELVELAQRADARGFAGVWTIEYEYDSIALDQAIAMSTEHVVTGSCIARNFTRHPLLMAQGAAMIDNLAPGRFIIGLGAGPTKRSGTDRPPQRWGLPADRGVARMSEYIDVLRMALSGAEVDHDGEFYPVQGVRLGLLPVSDHIPIYLAGGGPQMIRLAGRKADGIFAFLSDERSTRSLIDQVEAAAAQAGRPPGSVAVGSLIMTCVGDDGQVARDALRRHMIGYYLKLPTYQRFLVDQGFGEEAAAVVACLDRGDTGGAAACITDAVLDAWTIAGTPEECRAKLAAFAAQGIRTPILYAFPAEGDDFRTGYAAVIDCFAERSHATNGTSLRSVARDPSSTEATAPGLQP